MFFYSNISFNKQIYWHLASYVVMSAVLGKHSQSPCDNVNAIAKPADYTSTSQ